MPGETNTVIEPRERMLTVADLSKQIEAGMIVPLRDVRIESGRGAGEYMLVYVQAHGVALMSRETDRVFMITDFGVLMRAIEAGIDRKLDLILTPSGEVARG